MRTLVLSFLCGALFLAGCSLKVIPQQVPQGVINTADNSQTITNDGIAITAANSAREMVSYNLDGAVTAFDVSIHNRTDREVGFGVDSFVLLDDQNRQHLPLTPERVKEIVSRDSYYLIPYPYVGFYYLEDYERTSSYTETGSQLPYYYEVFPQDIFTRALNAATVIPGATAEGLVYFRIDLAAIKGMKLLVFRKGASKSAPPDFTFPFVISK
ncbi:hypothetical protein [Geobacter grbiciae]|uniref:hypothetical protein n=1 Tax=Geobacter grbiciae TaxID=155042 RepID=UPI001C016E5D|nr:hypothetical protein [Geobacter grbiciae]MBT1074476.1 hypothetical protein [Geobacter grbiciae]